jgi:hypothetical protein
MAKSRFNQFTLIFGNQTSYLAPLFPFMIDVPGYERLRTPDYTKEDRRKNLEALRMISALAGEWGVRFNLGIWQQHANNYGPNLVEGLSYQDLFDYCPKALAILLKECPHIGGVQFRMNSESGIQEDDQNRFLPPARRPNRWGANSGSTTGQGGRSKRSARRRHWYPARGFQCTARAHGALSRHRDRPIDKERSYRRYGYWDLLYHDRPIRFCIGSGPWFAGALGSL